MASCKECVHADMCRFYTEELAKAKGITLGEDIFEYFSTGDVCEHFKDHSRFVELTTARKIKQTPDSEIMKEFHKLGIGKGMSERSIFWICSNCKMWTSLAYTFCPNCGAKFEAEQALKEREENA